MPDIMKEVSTAHSLFSSYYDRFYDLFLVGDAGEIADCLAEFCRQNINYKEETMHRQTSALPTGFLTRGYGDCKHYSLFCAGVIAAINRSGKMYIPCSYYFAGYGDAKEPHHVFVCVSEGDQDVWIDPTPGGGSVPGLLKKQEV